MGGVFVGAAKVQGATLVVVAVALLCAAPAAAASQEPAPLDPVADGEAFDNQGMWIWYVSKANGGDPARMAARARRHRIGTVFIKAGDGDDAWSQFTPALVAALKARGLDVCAWTFVYGSNPVGEAAVAAAAVRNGADCLVIDAESSYEGRYAQATTYMRRLRGLVGADYPIGLSSFPYVHYHPSFPYSVFLGPGGAEFNLPQVYWRAIGTTVDKAIDTTYTYNRVYERPIDPVGQLYGDPPGREITRFRQLARSNGFGGVSWWSWQHASGRGWRAAGRRRVRRPSGYTSVKTYPRLERRASGDLVVWAQEHLVSGGFLHTNPTGEFGELTEQAVEAFQLTAGLPQTGIIDSATWRQLLIRLEPEPVIWERGSEPRSSALAARADELRPRPH